MIVEGKTMINLIKLQKNHLDFEVVFDLYKFSACAEKMLLLDHFVTTFNEIG